jgi:hypothetical protein
MRILKAVDRALVWVGSRAPGLALMFGAGWAVWTFWIKEFWIPARPAPLVNIEAHISAESPRNALLPVRCEISIENPSDKEARMFLAWFMVAGATMERVSLKDPGYVGLLRYALPSGDLIQRSARNREQKVLAVKALSIRALNPHEKRTNTFVTFVPADSFDVLRLHVWAVTQREDRGLVPKLTLTGGGWVEMRPGIQTGTDAQGRPVVIDVPETSPAISRSGFVYSETRTETSPPWTEQTARRRSAERAMPQ